MKVLVDARLGWGSGIGRYMANTIPRVASARPDVQFDVQVLAEDEARAAQAVAGVSNLSLRVVDIIPFSLREQIALPPLARGYDLTWFANYWVPLSFRGRYMATVHDLLHLRDDIFPVSPLKRLLSRKTFAHIARSAAGISFGSRFSKREFEQRFGPVANSAVHYYGIDHADWEPFDPHNPPPKTKRLLTVGATKIHKNFETLLAAWARARVGDHWTLSIITPDDKLRSSIDMSAISGAGLTDVRKGISNAELRALYAETQIILNPSLYEGFGLPYMEAMQAGAFCITSTAESMVEIGEGSYTYFVNPRDVDGWTKAIEQSCAMFDGGDFDFRPLQRHNMLHATQFNWQRVADVTTNLLGRIL